MYHLNEEMRPNGDECSACLCTENFQNSTFIRENSACERFRCLPQFRHFDDLRRGCVPVFVPGRCCAHQRFKCRRFRWISHTHFNSYTMFLMTILVFVGSKSKWHHRSGINSKRASKWSNVQIRQFIFTARRTIEIWRKWLIMQM